MTAKTIMKMKSQLARCSCLLMSLKTSPPCASMFRYPLEGKPLCLATKTDSRPPTDTRANGMRAQPRTRDDEEDASKAASGTNTTAAWTASG